MKGLRLSPRLLLCGLVGCAAVAAVPPARAAAGSAPPGQAASPLPQFPWLRRAFVDSTVLASEPSSTAHQRFATEGETEFAVEYKKIQLNVDLEFGTSGNRVDLGVDGPGAPNAVVEQAYMLVPLGPASLQAGAFVDPLGLEQEDAPDRDQVSHGQVWNLLAGQTTLPGNNVQGIALKAPFGHSSFYVALLNDLGGVENRHSLAIMLATEPAPHLRLQGGFATQAHLATNPASAETLLDLSAVWTAPHYSAALEYLAGDKLINAVYSVTGDYHWTKFRAAVRWDSASYLINTIHSTTTLTLTGAYIPAPGYRLAIEYQRNTNPNIVPVVLTLPVPGSAVRLQALVVF